MPISGAENAVVSRRALLGGSAVSVGAGVLGGNGASIMEAEAEDMASGEERVVVRIPIQLRVNGVQHALTISPNMTLAETLRGPLGLTGTKIACNRGACSACTVWLDGLPVCSCTMLTVEVGASEVRTIEGMADGETLHPVQAAFIEHDAMQCGYCTPGMVMSCAALLERNADPTPEDVERAIGGHVCRCGSYPHVVEATLSAARARRG